MYLSQSRVRHGGVTDGDTGIRSGFPVTKLSANLANPDPARMNFVYPYGNIPRAKRAGFPAELGPNGPLDLQNGDGAPTGGRSAIAISI